MFIFYTLTLQSNNERTFQVLDLFLDPASILAWVVKYFILNLLLIRDNFSQYETAATRKNGAQLKKQFRECN